MVVDDSPSIDQEIFNMEEFEGADWVRISDEVPVDEEALDEALEAFQTAYHAGDGRSVSADRRWNRATRSTTTDEEGEDPDPEARRTDERWLHRRPA